MPVAAIIVLVWTALLVLFMLGWMRWQSRMVVLDQATEEALAPARRRQALHQQYGRKYG